MSFRFVPTKRAIEKGCASKSETFYPLLLYLFGLQSLITCVFKVIGEEISTPKIEINNLSDLNLTNLCIKACYFNEEHVLVFNALRI